MFLQEKAEHFSAVSEKKLGSTGRARGRRRKAGGRRLEGLLWKGWHIFGSVHYGAC